MDTTQQIFFLTALGVALIPALAAGVWSIPQLVAWFKSKRGKPYPATEEEEFRAAIQRANRGEVPIHLPEAAAHEAEPTQAPAEPTQALAEPTQALAAADVPIPDVTAPVPWVRPEKVAEKSEAPSPYARPMNARPMNNAPLPPPPFTDGGAYATKAGILPEPVPEPIHEPAHEPRPRRALADDEPFSLTSAPEAPNEVPYAEEVPWYQPDPMVTDGLDAIYTEVVYVAENARVPGRAITKRDFLRESLED